MALGEWPVFGERIGALTASTRPIAEFVTFWKADLAMSACSSESTNANIRFIRQLRKRKLSQEIYPVCPRRHDRYKYRTQGYWTGNSEQEA